MGQCQIGGNHRTLERTIILITSIYLRSHKDHKRNVKIPISQLLKEKTILKTWSETELTV